ncbi:hypothetical protein CcaCcLH18_09337 [Colletotrichum camelliae]|nr:hypothetical protein CcaCcLH18_09337 [Colletotrichum camelliae]
MLRLRSILLVGIIVSPVWAIIPSPNYLPFELDKRDCYFTDCNCQRVRCALDFCFDDHLDPWVLVDTALGQYYGMDCGQFDSWQRNEPAEWCNNGLRKGNGVFYINRKWNSMAGYAVLSVNYRSGAGHGSAYAMATKGKAGTYDYSDIMTLVRHTLKKYADNVDETRVAVRGWSVGGYLSYLCATHGTGVAPDYDDSSNGHGL